MLLPYEFRFSDDHQSWEVNLQGPLFRSKLLPSFLQLLPEIADLHLWKLTLHDHWTDMNRPSLGEQNFRKQSRGKPQSLLRPKLLLHCDPPWNQISSHQHIWTLTNIELNIPVRLLLRNWCGQGCSFWQLSAQQTGRVLNLSLNVSLVWAVLTNTAVLGIWYLLYVCGIRYHDVLVARIRTSLSIVWLWPWWPYTMPLLFFIAIVHVSTWLWYGLSWRLRLGSHGSWCHRDRTGPSSESSSESSCSSTLEGHAQNSVIFYDGLWPPVVWLHNNQMITVNNYNYNIYIYAYIYIYTWAGVLCPYYTSLISICHRSSSFCCNRLTSSSNLGVGSFKCCEVVSGPDLRISQELLGIWIQFELVATGCAASNLRPRSTIAELPTRLCQVTCRSCSLHTNKPQAA